MPIHIEATQNDIAKVVLLPGDPKRTQYIAQNFLEDPKLYNENRYLLGYTGKYKGFDISIQTTGMGSPSLSIVVSELIDLKVRSLIRIGTCGAIKDFLNIGDIVIATGAHSSHNIYNQYFNGGSFSSIPDLILTMKLFDKSIDMGLKSFYGPILTSETFYEDSFDTYKQYSKYGTIAVEMESYPLFGLCMKNNIKAATVLTVSDIVFEKKRGEKDIIKQGVDNMIKLTLDTVIENYNYLS